MTANEARNTLDSALAQFGESPASSFTVCTTANEPGGTHSWWHARMKPNERSVTPRSLGYLLGYSRIAEDNPLLAKGLPLAGNEFLWMDRSVVKRFDRDGYLRWHDGEDPYFEIMPCGAAALCGNWNIANSFSPLRRRARGVRGE